MEKVVNILTSIMFVLHESVNISIHISELNCDLTSSHGYTKSPRLKPLSHLIIVEKVFAKDILLSCSICIILSYD